MSAFEIALVVCGAVLAVAALAVVGRMIIGPTILDRAISSDSLVTLVVMGMALYAAQSEAIWAGPAMLGLTGLAFIGTVAFARFVAREEPLQRRGGAQRGPATATGIHEAIHFQRIDSPSAAPANTFADPEGPEAADGAGVAPRSEADVDLAEDPVEDPEHPGEPLEEEIVEAHPPAGEDAEAGFGAEEGGRGFEDEWNDRDDGPGGTEVVR